MIDPARLPRSAVLAAFDGADCAALAALVEERRFSAGEPVWTAGCENPELFIILEGRVELSMATEFRERRVVMGIFGPGSVVGETGVFGGAGCTLTALAMEGATLAALSAKGLAALAESSPETHKRLLLGVLKALSRRLAQAYERMSSVF